MNFLKHKNSWIGFLQARLSETLFSVVLVIDRTGNKVSKKMQVTVSSKDVEFLDDSRFVNFTFPSNWKTYNVRRKNYYGKKF